MPAFHPEVSALGDRAFNVRLGDQISPEVQRRVVACLRIFDSRWQPQAKPDWVLDCVPGYLDVLVIYDGGRASEAQVQSLRALLAAAAEEACAEAEAQAPREASPLLEIPVLYHPEVAPDLEPLAAEKGLSIEQVIELHTAPEYVVYMLGFRPGFPFMGAVDPRLRTPRLATPRSAVAAGSVGIAGAQTGIYPAVSPGGWRVIGRTPLTLFDPARARPFLFSMGDRVRLVAVDRQRFQELCGAD